MRQGPEVDAEVVVVGYGPTGMAMAGLLGQAGHRVIVVERYAGLYNLPRAAIFDDETMRTLDKLGVAEEMLPKVRVQRNYEWCNAAGELLIEHSFDAKGRSGWAEWYMMYQPELEDALDRRCRNMAGVEVRFESTVVAVTNLDTHVTVDVEHPDGSRQQLAARYVVACDGGNSAMRQALGVGLDDYGFSEPWMVCDFRLRRPVALPPARQVGDPKQPVSIISLGPKHHRFSFMLNSAADFYTEGRPELVWGRVAVYLTPDDAELIRVATYSFSSLIALDWRVGRTVLAGDAAHQMPPFLGQGMCAGIRDAQNLAFKLDLILRGRRDDDLLDSYQMEREPHVRAITEKAIELGRLQTIRDPEAAAARDGRLLAGRAAGTKPEKMQFPGLASGLLSRTPTSGRGELFVQGDVDDGGGVRRFDEVVGRGFVAVATEAAYRALAASGSVARLAEAGVLAVGIAERRAGVEDRSDAGSSRVVLDAKGAYRRWFEDHHAVVAIARPDFYVFGTAAGIDEAEALINELLGDIAPTCPASAQQVAV